MKTDCTQRGRPKKAVVDAEEAEAELQAGELSEQAVQGVKERWVVQDHRSFNDI